MSVRRRRVARRTDFTQRLAVQLLPTGELKRGRFEAKFTSEQRRIEQQRQQAISDEREANKIIDSINAGKIKNLNQIPLKFRNLINVSQPQLNKISDFFAAKKDAGLWKEAFDLADRVLSSSDARAIFAIAFSENPHAKEAYRQLKSDYKAYQRRKKSIEDIRSGKTSNVKIIGNRIIDLDTGKPITPAAATSKQLFQTIQKDFPVGEKLIHDKNYKIIGISSAALQQSIRLNKKGIDYYNREIQKLPAKFDFKELVRQDITVALPEIKGIITVNILDDERSLVTFPNGLKVSIKNKGLTVIGARLAGKKYTFLNGMLEKINDKWITQKDVVKVIAPPEKVAPLFKRILSALSPKKARERREEQRKKLYDFYNLSGSNRNVYKLINVARTTPLNVSRQTQFNKIVLKHLKEDLLSEDTRIRAEIATVIAAIAGSVLIGGVVGAIYKTPIALARDLGVDEKLKNITWKEVAKKGGVEFGINAAQAYVALKIFGIGTRLATKIPALASFGLTKVGLQKSGILTQKILKTALKKGLNIVGAEYLSSIGIDVAKLAKAVKLKKYKAATIKASALLGTLVGFYGEKSVRGAFRKLLLREDPRLIKTAKPFAVESRDITVARLEDARKILKGEKLIVKFVKAAPVREPKKVKIVTPEKKVGRGVKIDVPTPAGYATYAVGKDVYIVSNVFLKLRKGATPKTYISEWLKSIRKKGVLPTFKELGIPRFHSPTLYKGSGEYLPRHRGESLRKYYARALRTANKRNIVQVVVAPKTILGATQKELEIKTVYPNPRGVKASVTRVNVGKDVFGNTIIVEIVAPKSVVERMKFKLKEKIKFKIEALKYLTKREAKIAKDLAPRVIENWNYYYVKKLRGHKFVREHSLRVEKNIKRIVKEYKIKLPKGMRINKVIRLTSRLHDILKLRGLNVKDEPIIRKMIKEGYLDKIPAVKSLRKAEKILVADTIGYHQDVNPRTLKALMLNKFTKAFINADRLDITRYGKYVKGKWIPTKVNPKKLFNLKAKSIIPKKIRAEFVKLTRLKIKKKGFTSKLRKRYNSLLKKYPGLKKGKLERKIMSENKKKFKKLSPRMKRKYEAEEKEYTDYKEAVAKYKRRKKIITYKTAKYKSYKYPKYKAAYKSGYTAGHKYRYKAPSNYKTNYGKYQSAYASGYKAAYKGNYKINYKTGKYTYTIKIRPPPTKPKLKPPIIPIPILPKGFKKKKLKRKQDVYYVVVKRRGKFVKLNVKPLVMRDAKDFLAYKLDHGLERSAWFEPLGKSKYIVVLPAKMKGYFSKNSKKLRPFKIRTGRKRLIRNGYIEKRKFISDTKREKGQLRVARRKARIRKKALTKRKSKKLSRRNVKKIRRRKKLLKQKINKEIRRRISIRKTVKKRTRRIPKRKIRRKIIKRKTQRIPKRTRRKKIKRRPTTRRRIRK